MSTGAWFGGGVLGVAVLAVVLAGCGGARPTPTPPRQGIQEDSDRFFDALSREERRHETGPGETPSGGGAEDERARRP